MRVHPQISHNSGIVTVTMIASFIGDSTDAGDQQRITAYGDPKINLAGQFTDPNDTPFAFTFPASELYAGVTTQMGSLPARFMTSLPVVPPTGASWHPFVPTQPYNPFGNLGTLTPCAGSNGTQQGSLDCVVTDPVRAATLWAIAIDARVQAAMTVLRAKTPAQLTSLPDTTV